MKIKNLVLCLVANILFSMSCTDNSDTSELKAVDLIIGEWRFISENDYYCNTNEVRNERLAENELLDIYKPDGTWQSFKNGVKRDWSGTWKNLGNNSYEFYFSNDDVTQLIIIEFEGTDGLKYFGVNKDCFDLSGESVYTYALWNKN